MNPLVPFVIPIRGLFPGLHDYTFDIDASFFEQFENAPVQDGNVEMRLELNKQSDMYVLQFEFEGTVNTDCDRCLAPIALPIEGAERLLVKFSLEETSEEAEVIFIHPETPQLDVSKYVYEFICLAIPMIKTYDCEAEKKKPCDEKMLGYLESQQEEEQQDNPIWDALKKLKEE
ncbi:MAG: DUF177 domain-containing protein [Saprospiraceae bacterium]|nr:DUF177 domain-containing protein [Saprospiraceae bacterium]